MGEKYEYLFDEMFKDDCWKITDNCNYFLFQDGVFKVLKHFLRDGYVKKNAASF
jgi:hypothetical protein